MQNSGPWDPWLPVVENSRLFAQRAHSARCAPFVWGLFRFKGVERLGRGQFVPRKDLQIQHATLQGGRGVNWQGIPEYRVPPLRGASPARSVVVPWHQNTVDTLPDVTLPSISSPSLKIPLGAGAGRACRPSVSSAQATVVDILPVRIGKLVEFCDLQTSDSQMRRSTAIFAHGPYAPRRGITMPVARAQGTRRADARSNSSPRDLSISDTKSRACSFP